VELPIIFTTGRTQSEDFEKGYRVGNMDYIKKPYIAREVILRIRQLLLPEKHPDNEAINYFIGKYTFIPAERLLKCGTEEMQLSQNEALTLKLLYDKRNTIVSRAELIIGIWGEVHLIDKFNLLNNIIYLLRSKLRGDATVSIKTVSKIGYKLMVKIFSCNDDNKASYLSARNSVDDTLPLSKKRMWVSTE
jgi:DNA-binding response OmpR family regulator